MLLFAHPKYYRGQNGIQVFVFESGNETSVLNSVDAFLSGQGYSEKEVLPLPATIVQSDKPGTFLLENHSVSAQILTEDFQRFYKNYLTQTYKAQDLFFVQSGQEIAIEESLKTITETEADFKQDNPYLAELIGKLYSEKMQNKMLGLTAESQRQELAIMQELFLANAKNNEIQYILDFYHKEYEALPLWYKRFGHILKACMGKRSWRSLLQDEHA